MLTFPSTAKWRIATVLLLVVILFMALASPFNLHVPASAEGTDPTATVTPTGTSTPTSTPEPAVPTAPSDADSDEAQTAGLFSEVEGDPPLSTDVETIASRLVGIDFAQIAEVTKPPIDPKGPATGQPSTPQTLVLNLFDDVVFTGIVEHVEPTASGHALWGSLEGVELGTMTLVVNSRIVVGTVRTPNAVYTIRTAGDGKYVIRQIDESSLPPLGEPLEIPPSSTGVRPKTDDGADPLDDGSVIDLMVMYTPLAKRYEGGRASIEALIDLFVAETNQAFAKSGVTHRINLVLRDEVDYIEEGGDFLTDIYRFRGDSDGYMDHVHELRDMYAADLVHLVVARSGVGGRAYIAYDESVAFGLTAAYRKDLAFPHEIGHNMGLHHDRYEVGVPLTGSNYGYVNQRMFEPGAPESARWNTIMAYPNQCSDVLDSWCAWLPYFSNPDKTYKGDPMGVPADHPSTGVDGPADAVGILNDRREIMANYRPSSTSPTPRMGLALSQYWLAEKGGVSTVTATLHRPSSEDTTVTISASPSDAVSLSANVTLTVPAGQSVSRGGVTITGVNNGDQTGDVIVEVSATAENPSSLGVIAPEPVELVIADDETTPAVTLSLSPVEIVEGGEWPENRTVVAAALDNRSNVDTTIAVSATPSDAVEEIYWDTLTIPAGQVASAGFGVDIYALNDDSLTEAEKSVTVSGNATNPHGVTGPASVTLTIIDDEAPYFADDSIAYTFTEGMAGSRFLPEAAYGNGELTYSLSPLPGSEVTFTPGPPAQIEVPASLEAGSEGSYTLTATDADGDTDTMTINFAVREAVCPNSAAVGGYSDPEVVSDCEALLASRDALSVDRSLNWDEDLPINEWEGVELAGNRVVELRLVNEGIVGAIPSELGNLASLRTLSLWNNRLTGGIPKELGNLANLQSLNLNENRLTGEIPSELGSLAKLTRLALNDNQLTGEIPSELSNLANLQRLYLRENRLTGCVPDGLRDVPNNDLAELGLPFCIELACSTLAGGSNGANIPGLVSDCVALLTARDTLAGTAILNWSTDTPIADWSGVVLEGTPGRVTELRLGSLGLTGEIPPELGSLSDLQHLNLSDNNLTGGIPTELGDLSNLQELFLGGNRLSGCVPNELRDIPSNDFASLDLPFCSEHPCVSGGAVADVTNPGLLSDCETLLAARDTLAGTATLNWSADTPITEWVGVSLDVTQGRVTRLDLSKRELTGEIPTELGSLTKLTSLLLYSNGLTGEIPKELGTLANLEELFLYSNGLTGEIPTELGNFVNLHSLFISNNQLTGEIPTELGNLVKLQTLSLSGNRLNGEIPTELGNLTRMQSLYIGGNPLTGEIPTELGNLGDLRTLWLEGNQLTGRIPKELGSLANLQSLLLSSNALTGEIPAEFGNLDNLKTLNVSKNQLTGEIPTWLGNLDNLKTLNISNNQLTGEIPTELGNLDNLKWLYLNDNDLTGEIPTEFGNLDNLKTLALSSNQLTGIIPTVLGNLANLQTLWLGGNRLTSGIPKELGNLADLRGLYLGSNRLTGQIPTELGRLNRLVQLLLNHNDLEGSIPASLGNLRNLERLWLSNNRLTGCVPPRLRDVPDNDFARLGLSFCALSPPDAPTIGSVTPELDSLAISWSPPLNDGGSDITAYDLRYIETDGDETVDSNWTVVEDVWTPGRGALGYRLTGLTGGIQYDIQVRAVNAEGDSPWSETVTGTPSSSVCVSGGAVADATNSGQISDCEALLEGRDTLAGTATLNWAEDTPITQWNGVGLGGTPQRVTRLKLAGKGLDGTVSSELGRLSKLTYLNLRSNELTGEIPDELDDLSNLRVLNLHSNSLSGGIPDLSGMTSLEELYLPNNADYDVDGSKVEGTGLTGEIPTWLNGMTNMRELWLWGNSLSGSVPDLSGMTSLQKLKLANNDLDGGVPQASTLPPNMTWLIIDRNPFGGTIPDMSSLSRLRLLWLHSSELEGMIPAGDMFPTSLDDLNLRDNMLMGTIPDLSNLDMLTRLRLHNNSLSGEVPATLGGLDSLKYLWLHNEVEKGLGSNMLTSIAAGVGGLGDTLIVITLDGNPWNANACVPAALANVARNDYAEAGIAVCSAGDGS